MFRPLRIFLIVIGALLVLLGVIAVLGIIFGTAVIASWPFHHFFFGRLFALLFVLLLLFFGLRLLLWPLRYRRYGRAWRNYDPAMDTLRQRYARGEISKEQFEQMSHDLEQHRWEQKE